MDVIAVECLIEDDDGNVGNTAEIDEVLNR
jgi:hypothetical protein